MGPYTPLVPAILMLLAYSLRRFAPAGGWLHTLGGATAIAFVSGLLGALAQAIQAHGFSSATVVPAISSFVLSFIATSNPTMSAAEKKEEATLKGGALVVLLALGIALSGCGTAAGKVMKTCELGQLAADSQPAVALAQAIASDPGSAVADLEAAALKFLPGQFECAAQALAAWWASRGDAAPSADPGIAQALIAAHGDAQALHARDVLERYLAAHKPVACSGQNETSWASPM